MIKQILRKACSGILMATLIFSTAVVPGSVSYAATTPKDVQGHWAQKYVEKAISAGLVKGYTDGTFKPERPVTRAEFAHMINSALGNSATASISFKDVKSTDWHYSDVSKAVAAGYANGYTDNTFGPSRPITRQEAAVMLAKMVPTYGSNVSLSGYPDYKKIGAWAKNSMERMVGKGYINVYTNDKKLHPTDKMTRAQAATMIVNVLEKETIVKSTANITANGSQLSNTIYSNGITIAKSSGSGQVDLSKCVVLGTLSVRDGSTVNLTNSRVAQATVQSNADTNVVAKGETYVKNASVANTASLQTTSLVGDASFGPGFVNISIVKDALVTMSGNFPRVSIDGTSTDVTLSSGKVESLVIPIGGSYAHFTVESGASLSLATVSTPAYFHGTGTVSKLMANASGITYEKKPSVVTVGSGVTAPTTAAARSTIRPNPANGKTGVSTNTNITISFNTAMKLYAGSALSRADVEDIVELRRNSPAGSKMDFTAAVNSGSTTITLTPEDELDKDTKYYIVIGKNSLKDTNGTGNVAFLSSFTTGTSDSSSGSSVSDYLTFKPGNGGKNVDLDVEPTIEFSESLLFHDGTSIKDDDLSDIIIFREKNSSGRKVAHTAYISSDKETITIEPDDELDENTAYYLAVADDSLTTAARGTDVPEASVTWTTGDGSESSGSGSDYMSFTPKNNKSDIAIDVTPEIRFTEAMQCEDGSTITSRSLNNIIIFREKNSSGRDVDFSATIDSAKKVVTITPEDDLKENTKYYLAVDSKSIETVSRERTVAGASVVWTTGDEDSSSDYVSFYPRDGKKNIDRKEEPTITFSERMEFYNGDSIDSGRNSDLEDCITFEDEDGDEVSFKAYYETSDYEITIVPSSRLSSDTEYTLTVNRKAFRTRSGETAIPTCSVTWTTE